MLTEVRRNISKSLLMVFCDDLWYWFVQLKLSPYVLQFHVMTLRIHGESIQGKPPKRKPAKRDAKRETSGVICDVVS